MACWAFRRRFECGQCHRAVDWGDTVPDIGAALAIFLGGILMAGLLAIALRRVTPGREQEASMGLARGGGGH
ncbi:MAG: hypothetical protein M5U34_42185 [Chloroflexi bacterium]|nr:hypothetical protein [Chloroflexota bacterium]